MKLKNLFNIFLVLVVFYSIPASANTPVATDSRIKTFVYSDTEVFRIKFHYNYQSHIEFAHNEEIELISLGDSYGWQITPADRRLFIKPMETNSRTNMTVITNKRSYQFELIAAELTKNLDEELVYVIRFFYPDQNFDNRVAKSVKSPIGIPSQTGRVTPQQTTLQAQQPPIFGQAPAGSSPGSNPFQATEDAEVNSKMSEIFSRVTGGSLVSIPQSTGTPMTRPPSNSQPNIPISQGSGSVAKSQVELARTTPPTFKSQSQMQTHPKGANPFPRITPPRGTAPTSMKSIPRITDPSVNFNFNYTFVGKESRITPLTIYDDGRKTYFQFAPGVTPRISKILGDNSEQIVNYSFQRNMIVVPGTNWQYVIRDGNQIICVFNEQKIY